MLQEVIYSFTHSPKYSNVNMWTMSEIVISTLKNTAMNGTWLLCSRRSHSRGEIEQKKKEEKGEEKD